MYPHVFKSSHSHNLTSSYPHVLVSSCPRVLTYRCPDASCPHALTALQMVNVFAVEATPKRAQLHSAPSRSIVTAI